MMPWAICIYTAAMNEPAARKIKLKTEEIFWQKRPYENINEIIPAGIITLAQWPLYLVKKNV